MTRTTNRKADRLLAGLEIRQRGDYRQIDNGRYIVRSQSKANRTYSVGIKHGEGFCSCPDSEVRNQVCKHQLAVLFPDAMAFMLQCRWVRDLEELNDVVEVYRVKMFDLPLNVKELARKEYSAARNRLQIAIAA